MSEELLAAIADKLPRIRTEVRREVSDRLAQGAQVGAAKDGEVLCVSLDPVSGRKKARVVQRYARSAGPLEKKSGRADDDTALAGTGRAGHGRR